MEIAGVRQSAEMSSMRRVLLLLCVAALLREGRSNSPLDFLRDLKNKIFSSSNSSESTENSPIQCSGINQDGVCTLQNTTTDGTMDSSENFTSIERFDNPEPTNESTRSDQVLANYQYEGNETAVDNSNITQYYDEQDWNNTTANNTGSFGNDFEYPEINQNGTDLNIETVEGNKGNTENTRSKRQINKVEINITLKAPTGTSSPSNENATISTGKNYGNASGINDSINATEGKETNSKESVISSSVQNVLTTDVNGTNDGDETNFKTEVSGNEIKENITPDVLERNGTMKNVLVGSEESGLVSNNTLSESFMLQNMTEEVNNNEPTSLNCTECVNIEESFDLHNVSLKKDFNETEYEYLGQIGVDENTTKVNVYDDSDLTNVTKLKDILENSTDIIRKIVQNVVPVLTGINNETDALERNDAIAENVNKTEERKVLNITVTESVTTLPNTSGEDFIVTKSNSSNAKHINDTIITQSRLPDDSAILDNNVTVDSGSKRNKRYINFTILSEDEDFSTSSFPDTTEGTGLSSNSMGTDNEHFLGNGTEEIKVLGPVCKKQFEQCANSTDCCEDYECVDTGTYNSTLYCDLRPQNLSLSQSLP